MELFFLLGLLVAGGYVLGVIGFFRANAAHTELAALRRQFADLLARTTAANDAPVASGTSARRDRSAFGRGRSDVPAAPILPLTAPPPSPFAAESSVAGPPEMPEPPAEPVASPQPTRPEPRPSRDLEELLTARWGVWLGAASTAAGRRFPDPLCRRTGTARARRAMRHGGGVAGGRTAGRGRMADPPRTALDPRPVRGRPGSWSARSRRHRRAVRCRLWRGSVLRTAATAACFPGHGGRLVHRVARRIALRSGHRCRGPGRCFHQPGSGECGEPVLPRPVCLPDGGLGCGFGGRPLYGLDLAWLGRDHRRRHLGLCCGILWRHGPVGGSRFRAGDRCAEPEPAAGRGTRPSDRDPPGMGSISRDRCRRAAVGNPVAWHSAQTRAVCVVAHRRLARRHRAATEPLALARRFVWLADPAALGFARMAPDRRDHHRRGHYRGCPSRRLGSGRDPTADRRCRLVRRLPRCRGIVAGAHRAKPAVLGRSTVLAPSPS